MAAMAKHGYDGPLAVAGRLHAGKEPGMQNRARSSAHDIAAEVAPWRKGIPWYLVVIEGVIALAIGLYFVFDTDAAQSTIRRLIALALIVISAVDIWNGFAANRDPVRRDPMTPFRLVRGGIGVTVGIIAVSATRWGWMTEEHIREALGFGLLAYGLIGIIGILASWSTRQISAANLAGDIFSLALGIVLIYNDQEQVSGADATRYLGYAAIVGGVVLLAYGYYLYRDRAEVAMTGTPAPAGETSLTSDRSQAASYGPSAASIAGSSTLVDQSAPHASPPEAPPSPPTPPTTGDS